ncbi:hypothetical protein WJX73_006943 [Symbiochloris irregularis]|uniref:TOG domain-containing protein n=1 Tax=Symbiochloris irregularis TaxID=706552 RepID=A0AAW1NWM6_9CHLO
MASLVVLECDVDNSGAGQPNGITNKLQTLKLRQQESRRVAKARLSQQTNALDLDQGPMELAGSAMPIVRRSSDLRSQMAGKAMQAPVAPSEEFIGSQVYRTPFEEAGSRMSGFTAPDSRPTTSSSARSISSRPSGSRPATSSSNRGGPVARITSQSAERPGSAASMGSLQSQDLAPYEDLGPFLNPDAVLQTVLNSLAAANVAKRLELDWQAQNEAIQDARRLVQHHPEVVEPNLHPLMGVLLPAVDALRSQTAKDALSLLLDMVQAFGRALDPEVEAIVAALVKKAGEMSTAGRETFLAMEASNVLSVMTDLLSVSRVAAALIACSGHKAAPVKYKAALHLDGCLQGTNGQRLSGAQGMLAKVFKAAVQLLDEGREETRVYAKRVLWATAQLSSVTEPGGFDRMLKQLTNEDKRKKIAEFTSSSAGCPPPPNKYTAGATMARSAR